MTIQQLYLLLIIALLLAGCGEEQGLAGTIPEPTPSKPWDWIPEEHELATGREIYLAECALCHDEGEENAPPLTRTAEWEQRAAKGLPTLVQHAIEGFKGESGEMPARGGTDSLTDEEVAAAVKFMLAAPK